MAEGAHTSPRIHLVDALRAFALLGIVAVNIGYFASAYVGAGTPDPDFTSSLDGATRWVVATLFETKFYLLFSFLFGYSFTIQMENAARANAQIGPRFRRRLLGLAAFGAAHAVFLYVGDILITYALMGVVLLAVRYWPTRRVLVGAALIMVVLASLVALFGVAVASDPELAGDDRATLQADARDAEAGYSGTPAEVIETRLDELAYVLPAVLAFQGPSALALFVLGLAAGRARALEEPERFGRLWRRLLLAGAVIGLPGGVLYAWGTVGADGDVAASLYALAATLLVAPVLSAGYVAAIVLFSRSPAGQAFVRALAPAGRMALTNYILQSLVMALIFTGYGAALIGEVSPLGALAIAFGIFAAQLPLSAWWMRRHAYGPLEWVLRSFTHLRRPRWRTASA